jgi:hypothetical protein
MCFAEIKASVIDDNKYQYTWIYQQRRMQQNFILSSFIKRATQLIK